MELARLPLTEGALPGIRGERPHVGILITPTMLLNGAEAEAGGAVTPCCGPDPLSPSAWTDAHHLVPWWLGGPTNIDNLLLLCRYHHHKVHEGRWRLTLDQATGDVHVRRPDGRPYEVGAGPPFVSPTRQPRAA